MSQCEEYRDLFELWVLSALEEEEQDAITRHLRSGCETCTPRAERALSLTAHISESVPLVQPPARLRRKVEQTFAAASEAPRRSAWQRFAFWPMAGLMAASLAIAAYFFTSDSRLRSDLAATQARNAAINARLSSLATILQAPGTKEVTFGPNQPATPRGSVFVHQRLGIVLIAGELGTAPAGWTYETWVVPQAGNPRPVESWMPDPEGRAISVIPGPAPSTAIKAVAVSLEPPGATLEKPTRVLFATPI